MTESNRIEFKRELTRELDIEKEVVAFLNYREGGIIYIGIDDSGKPVGVQDIDGDMLAIKNRLRDNILPSPMGLFDVTVERIEGVPVIRVFVSSGSEKPYYKKQRIMRKYTKDNFEFGDNYVRMAVPYNWIDEQENVTGKVKGKVTGKVKGKVKERVKEKTSDKILRLITANPSITIARMMVALSMSDSGVRKVLRNMQAQGTIRRVGPDKTGHWEIIMP